MKMRIFIYWTLCAFIIVADPMVLNASLLDSKVWEESHVGAETTKFLASLRKNGTHFCSGGLVSYKYVLTAAQCIKEIRKHNPLTYTGELVAFINGINYEIAYVKTHPNYDREKLEIQEASSYDIGLIELEVPLDLNSNHSSSLHANSISIAKPFILYGEKATIFSWHYKYPYHPQRMDITIESSITCHKIIKEPLSRNFVKDRQLCGIPHARDLQITAEDAGSPVVYNNFIIAIVAPGERFHDDCSIVIMMRVNILKYFFPELILSPIPCYPIGTLFWRDDI